LAACRACVQGDAGACRADFDRCVATPKCADFIECAFQGGCFAPPALEDRIACGSECLTRFGITGTDPAIAPIVAMNLCSLNACREVCVQE
jgi:hypothetical protein